MGAVIVKVHREVGMEDNENPNQGMIIGERVFRI